MNSTKNYIRIEKAIQFLDNHFTDQPSLETIASHVGLSKFHFQRMFEQWAGVSPKTFLQCLTAQHAKRMLCQGQSTLDTAYSVGLTGTGRLHDLFVKVESMTPGEYKSRGQGMKIIYAKEDTVYGKMLLAETQKGICHISFFNRSSEALDQLKKQWPLSDLKKGKGTYTSKVQSVLDQTHDSLTSIPIILKGTPFQVKVWEALITIPPGRLVSYQAIAQAIDHPKAVRAVGTAVGANPVAYLIPCHRVIRETGIIGQYRWGPARKAAMIGRESVASRATTAVKII